MLDHRSKGVQGSIILKRKYQSSDAKKVLKNSIKNEEDPISKKIKKNSNSFLPYSSVGGTASESKKEATNSFGSNNRQTQNDERIVGRFHRKSEITEGSLYIGVVYQLKSSHICVQLGNQITGIIPLDEIIESNIEPTSKDGKSKKKLERMLSDKKIILGQCVRCVVLSVSDGDDASQKKKVVLSMKTNKTNNGEHFDDIQTGSVVWGALKSVEDYGYNVELGITGIHAFLHKDEIDENMLENITIGSSLFFSVKKKISESKVLLLSNKCDAFNSIEKSSKSKKRNLKSLKPGLFLLGKVTQQNENGVAVSFFDNFQGWLEIFDMEIFGCRNKSKWNEMYSIGSEIKARILSINYSSETIRLTQRPHLMNLAHKMKIPKSGLVYKKCEIIGTFKDHGIVISLPENGDADMKIAYASYSHFSMDATISDIEAYLKVGKKVSCVTTGFCLIGGYMVASLNKSDIHEASFSMSYKKLNENIRSRTLKRPGKIVFVKMIGASNVANIDVELQDGTKAYIPFSEIDDEMNWTDAMVDSFTYGQVKKALILSDDGQKAFLSLRTTRIKLAHAAKKADTQERSKELIAEALQQQPSPKKGDIIKAIVSMVEDRNCFVTISNEYIGKINILEAGSSSTQQKAIRFKRGKIIFVKVLSVNEKKKTLKLATVNEELLFEEFKKGKHVTGVVSKINDEEIFVKIDNTPFYASSTKSSMKEKVDDILNFHTIGEKIRAKILRVDKANKNISIRINPSSAKLKRKHREIKNEETAMQNILEGTDSKEKEKGERKITSDGKFQVPLTSLAFEFDDFKISSNQNMLTEGSDEGSDESGDETDAKTNKEKNRAFRKKAAKKQKEEKEVHEREKALVDDNKDPETVIDFERLLVASPNSSIIWLKYMAYHLSLSDLAAARAVAERALKRIQYRMEDERNNIWVTWMNMELKYGTKEELSDVFQRACASTNPKHMYLKLAEAHENARNTKEAEFVLSQAAHKFKTSKKVWIAYQHFFLRMKNEAKANELLKRSLLSLSRQKHIFVMTRFAAEEYKNGLIESGRSIYEGLIQSFPKRTDIWNNYIDKEIKEKNQEYVRALFERMILLKLKPFAMKSIFKKYLAYETQHGNDRSIDEVKEKAMKYVQELTK